MTTLIANPFALTFSPAISTARHTRSRALPRPHVEQVSFVLENDVAAIRPVVNRVQTLMRGLMNSDDAELMQVHLALEEAISNAIIHGNLEVDSAIREDADGAMKYAQLIRERANRQPYARRRVRVNVRVTAESAEVLIKDEGSGFDHRDAPDPTAAEQLDKSSGRGLFMMRSLMDEVRFNRRGNAVTLVKRRPA